ncbi:hypothetical protein A2U01_0084351 [Trifolium medium]|uniref:Uncharacterized protein n=1 Tax=Trifolium medium TaxID=97028 RepID=A0A392TR00_9FABA|nr:hypothetical protein [Trifolium medium]
MAGENSHPPPPPITLQDAIAEIRRLQTKMASVEKGKADKELGTRKMKLLIPNL